MLAEASFLSSNSQKGLRTVSLGFAGVFRFVFGLQLGATTMSLRMYELDNKQPDGVDLPDEAPNVYKNQYILETFMHKNNYPIMLDWGNPKMTFLVLIESGRDIVGMCAMIKHSSKKFLTGSASATPAKQSKILHGSASATPAKQSKVLHGSASIHQRRGDVESGASATNPTTGGEWGEGEAGDKVHLCMIMVIPRLRRRGLGTEMLKHVVMAHPRATITLSVMFDQANVMGFYLNRGYAKLTSVDTDKRCFVLSLVNLKLLQDVPLPD